MTSTEPVQAAAAAVLDGTGLTCAKVREIARDAADILAGQAVSVEDEDGYGPRPFG